MKNLDFIKEQIQAGDYTILPESIAIGTAYKIPSFGSLEKDGIELGYLYLPKGSGIKSHQHINDIEQYRLLFGTLRVNSIDTTSNVCLLGKWHDIACVEEDTIVRTCKVSKLALDMLENFSDEAFDQLIAKIRNEKKYYLK